MTSVRPQSPLPLDVLNKYFLNNTTTLLKMVTAQKSSLVTKKALISRPADAYGCHPADLSAAAFRV